MGNTLAWIGLILGALIIGGSISQPVAYNCPIQMNGTYYPSCGSVPSVFISYGSLLTGLLIIAISGWYLFARKHSRRG